MRVKLFLAWLTLSVALSACALPRDTITIEVTANTSLNAWLQDAIDAFNSEDHRTASDKSIIVRLQSIEAGQAVSNMINAGSLPALWIPDDAVWADVLADRGQAAFQGHCVSVAESPLVIAMWRPLAEALGWPGRSLGWLDIGSLAADPSAWAYYSGGQFGPSLRIGHAHPGLSASGTNTLLALVQSAESKTEAVTRDEIQQPIVEASVRAFEGSVATFSTSASQLGQSLSARDARYLGAAIVYESTTFETGNADIVPIYPLEGTFVATHPACLNTSSNPETQEAATIFRDYLLGRAAQNLATTKGLRSVNDTADSSASMGIDLSQPAVRFDPPGVDAVYAVQELWQAARKNVNLIMLLDTSASMRGNKIANMRTAAIQFVEQMGDNDFITVIAFSTRPELITDRQSVGSAREDVLARIAALDANGETALYDAIGMASNIIAGSTSNDIANVIVVLTDGQDTVSNQYAFDATLIDLASAHDTGVFTIAYGDDADEDRLAALAGATGSFYLGNEANIFDIYQEMSVAFGGSAGIGR